MHVRGLLLSLLLAADAPAQTPLQYSADVTLDLIGVGFDHDYFLGAPAASARVALAGLPDRADLDALHVDADFGVLVSLDVAAMVDGVAVRPADVLRHLGGNYELVFDASAAGVPDGVDCDAVARLPSGPLLLSFDRSFAASGWTIDRADVVVYDGSGFTRLLDLGEIADRLDVDAIHAESETVLLLSFATGGSLGGVSFADEDILALDLTTLGWTLRHDMSAVSSRWESADLDALSAASVGDGLFTDSFE